MNKVINKLQSKNQKGATMVEYAIMLVLIAVVSITIITSLGQKVSTTFGTVNTAMGASG